MYSVKASISFNASLALQLILFSTMRVVIVTPFSPSFACPLRLLQVFCVIVKSKLKVEIMN